MSCELGGPRSSSDVDTERYEMKDMHKEPLENFGLHSIQNDIPGESFCSHSHAIPVLREDPGHEVWRTKDTHERGSGKSL